MHNHDAQDPQAPPIVLGVITARGGSKGIPGKNIKLLAHKPLISYTIDVAKKSNTITHLIVSTDDMAIADVARAHGADVPFMRPETLATDDATHRDVMQHAIETMEDQLDARVHAAVILQPTSPFRTPEDIDMTVAKLLESDADSAVTLVEALNDMHPVKAKKFENGRVEPYSMAESEGTRRQDLPPAYRRSGAVYAMRRETIMDKGLLYGDHIAGHVVPLDRSIDIDEPFDWIKAEYMIEQLKAQGFDF